MADNLLCTLILASEKASRIARLCRENKELFSLLIEKKGEKHNEIDFKTLADVFIQQIVTKEVKMKFGKLADNVRGEENNQFTNTLGETISVEIAADVENTTHMLAKVLNGNETAGRILAEAAHEPTSVDLESIISSDVLEDIASSDLNLEKIGIWIDPIDGTSQYVEGIEDATPMPNGIYEAGLQCAMVLIGVYSLDTGRPIAGIINQPFCNCAVKNGQKRWKNRCMWGYSHNCVKRNNLEGLQKVLGNNSHPGKSIIVLSSHDPDAMSVLKSLSATTGTCLSRGAGYKCLTVMDQLADLFLYTLDGSYKWDTCAPHAILNSSGGGVAILNNALKVYGENTQPEDWPDILEAVQVVYNTPKEKTSNSAANSGGLLVYNGTSSSLDAARRVLKALCDIRA